MVPISPTKLQSGSGPVCSSSDRRGPPENNRFGPSANRCLAAAVTTAVTGISRRQSAITTSLLANFIAAPSARPAWPLRWSARRKAKARGQRATHLADTSQAHLPVQLGIRGLIDLPHAPLADEGGDGVVGEAGADFQRHRLWLDLSTQITPIIRCATSDQRRDGLSGVQR